VLRLFLSFCENTDEARASRRMKGRIFFIMRVRLRFNKQMLCEHHFHKSKEFLFFKLINFLGDGGEKEKEYM
jgi:hypothetical protein